MYNKKAMFKKILSIVTLLLVGVVVYGARNEIVSAFQCIFGGQCMDGSHFSINFWIVLLLIPEQLFMYYSAGKIFFSYMAGKAKSQKNITRIIPRITPTLIAATAPTIQSAVFGTLFVTNKKIMARIV